MIYYNGENIEDILKGNIVILDFYADWCGPCKMLGEELEDLSEERRDLKIVKINTDKYPDLAVKYGVMTIPNVYIYMNGKEINHFAGYKDKAEIIDLIK
mgnify:FL=1